MKSHAFSFLLLLVATASFAAPVDFVREVQPILKQRCYECHGEKKQKSGLRLDLKAAAFKGGDDHGASIIPGDAQKSPLVALVKSADQDERMPPKGDALPAAEIETLARWVAEGAVWPDGVDAAKVEDKRDHWSFKPLTHAPPPQTKDGAWPRGEIDRFILARLEAEHLQPAPEAERIAWLRRVTLDLTGLPPAPAEVDAFCADQRPDAYERVVDALLASPRYGERWAQHWLDVVRYADTHGFEVNTERPNAWPYRDYVIRAFNADTPYDRFVREQLVGDALGQETATGFLVTASVLLPGQIGKDAPSIRLARQDSLDEIVMNIGQTFLGLSVGCARCHDHKFDPISQREYYAMQALVAGVEYQDRELQTPEAIRTRKEMAQWKGRVSEIDKALSAFVPRVKSGAERPPVNARENVERFAPMAVKRVRFTIRETNKLEPCLDELEVFNVAGQNVALARAGAVASSSGDIVVAGRHDPKHINDGEYGNARSWLASARSGAWVMLEFPEVQTIDRIVWGRDREGKFTDRLAIDYLVEAADANGEWRVVADASDRQKYEPDAKKPSAFSTKGLSADEKKEVQPLIAEKAALAQKISAAEAETRAFAGRFRAPDEIHLLSRGDPEQPKDEVLPAMLSVLGERALPKETPEQERRRALAEWIASPTNPLTARVMVNRIWQGHFGTGIVETPSDFGRSGLKPTHPELLDWLAGEFIRSGWSVKHLHRLIVLSATYRQSSAVRNAAAHQRDADARLLWRFPARRLEGETIRDAMLAVSGQLSLKMYGRGFDLFDKRGGLTGFNPVESFTGEGLRRIVYAHKVRRERDAVFGAFDCPDAGQSTPRRRESTTPIQALNLLNSKFTLETAAALAARVKAAAPGDAREQISGAYRLALSRPASADEIADAEPVVAEHGLTALCRALFNSNEFLYLP